MFGNLFNARSGYFRFSPSSSYSSTENKFSLISLFIRLDTLEPTHEHPASLALWPNNSTWNRIFRRPARTRAGQRTAPRVLAVDSPPDISRILLLFRVDNFKFIKVVGKQIYFYNALNSASQGEQVIFQAASVTE